jgi:hypothetical protein
MPVSCPNIVLRANQEYGPAQQSKEPKISGQHRLPDDKNVHIFAVDFP